MPSFFDSGNGKSQFALFSVVRRGKLPESWEENAKKNPGSSLRLCPVRLSIVLLFKFSGRDPRDVPDLGFRVFSTLYGMLFAYLGASLAARLSPGYERKQGAALAFLLGLGALLSIVLQWGEASPWSSLMVLVFMAPMALLAGWRQELNRLQ
jgi:hypothetical protein